MFPVQYEYRVKFEDGTINTHYVNTLPRKEEDGTIIWRGFITDITERKHAEVALLQQNEENIWQEAELVDANKELIFKNQEKEKTGCRTGSYQ